MTRLLFNLLYNLFNIELIKLKYYLNDILTKILILFILKKNEDLRLYINY